MKLKTASIVMALWIVAAGAWSAVLSVCASPCCMPALSVSAGECAGHGDSAECGMEGQSSEYEAALFFAEETGQTGLFQVAADHHFRGGPGCTAELKVKETQTALAAKHISSDPPKAAPVEVRYSDEILVRTASPHPETILHTPGGPPGTDPQTLLSRFIC